MITIAGSYRGWSLMVLLMVCGLALRPAPAQEAARRLRELDEEIQEAVRRQRHLRRLHDFTNQRLEHLRTIRNSQAELVKLEEQVEAAEEAEDERQLERLETQIERHEFVMEVAGIKLEICDQRVELVEITGELQDSPPALKEELESLFKMLGQGEQVAGKLLRAYDDEEPEEVESLFEQLEEAERALGRRREVLMLRVEIQRARREGELEEVGELEEELESLQRESRLLTAPPDPREMGQLPAPIELTETDMAAVAKMDFDADVLPLMKRVCFECHANDTVSGELDLQQLVQVRPLAINRSHWLNVMQQIRVRSMPPADADQPADEERRKLLAWLTEAIHNFDYTTVQQPGYEPVRRLSHEEYNHTVRDLVGMDVRPADRFPIDLTASSGFENSANSLFIQPVMLERYIHAAELIVNTAWPVKPATTAELVAQRRLFGNADDLEAAGAVDRILRRFTTRAYRRPIEAAELQALMGHYQRLRRAGVASDEALRQVLQVVLVSPSFLLRVETQPTKPGVPQRVTDWELASRLSYFLWASMPDDDLLRLAAGGKLHEPQVLYGQVERMLDDPKSRTLGELFAAQWLRFADLDRVQRDQIDNPWATDSLVAAMQQESAMLFNALVAKNEPIDRLLDADFTFVNEELAKHYSLRGVRGEKMRQVSLQATPRRGILGHASILAVTSFPGRTSPVVRGDWILRHLLGTPPPPPPPNVSEFSDRIAENEGLSQRQKLELHRSNPNCYACHSQIDPLGFALEEFEWFGRYRPRRRGERIDATGKLPNGSQFHGLAELSQTLVADRMDDVAVQATRKMLAYALGRQLEYYDEASVQQIVREWQGDERRLRTLIHTIVGSDTFQKQQRPAGDQEANR
ncbi:MAG TPA: hypothetical protein DCY79_06630 [Planctomycetaceae bacterium]|nr:hypothetical protein [Planctomycetaceae bacterium]